MRFRLLGISGYVESIISLQMSKGKFYSYEKTMGLYDLVRRVTNSHGFLLPNWEAYLHNNYHDFIRQPNEWAQENYEKDKADFTRRLEIVLDNAMKTHKHHTLMKYIDFSFVSEGMHRGAQDDLDAHAIAFNNRITRFSTRLANISEPEISEWYQGKILPFHMAFDMIRMAGGGEIVPQRLIAGENTYVYTPFGYMLEKYAGMSHNNGMFKDVQRGLIGLGHPGPALWKIDIANFRYVYHMRSKLTKANPELKDGMEQLADQLEQRLPVFGPYIRKVFTADGTWEHTNRARLVSVDFFRKAQALLGSDVDEGGHELTEDEVEPTI